MAPKMLAVLLVVLAAAPFLSAQAAFSQARADLLTSTLGSNANYSSLWGLINDFQLVNVLADDATGPLTILAPSNVAFHKFGDTDRVVRAILPDSIENEWTVNVVKYHVYAGFVPSSAITGNTTGASVLGPAINVTTNGTTVFVGSSLYSTSVVAPDLQGSDTTIAIHGIDDVILPANLSTLVPPSWPSGFTFDKSAENLTLPAEVLIVNDTQFEGPQIRFEQLTTVTDFAFFSTIRSILNATHANYAFANLEGGTLLLPIDAAFEQYGAPIAVAGSLLEPAEFLIWGLKLLQAHILKEAVSGSELLKVTSGNLYNSILGPAVFFRTEGVNTYLYRNGSDPLNDDYLLELPNFQDEYVTFAIHGIDGILYPLNATRLVPLTAIATGAVAVPPSEAPASPAPTSSAPPSPPPKAAPELLRGIFGAVLALVLGLAMMTVA